MNNKQATFNFKNVLSLHVVIVLLMLAGSAYVWLQTPSGAQIPVHFDASGTPDRYGGKVEGLLMLPAITAGLLGLFILVPRIEPRKFNLMQSARVYEITWGLTALLMLVVHIGVLASVMGYALNMGLVVPVAVGLMLIVVGNYMGKLRSTWFMGIRTPWTLTSELSWNKTHRLGGRAFMLLGLAIMLTSALGAEVWAIVVAVGSIAMVIGLFAYSYFIWKQDPAVQQSQS